MLERLAGNPDLRRDLAAALRAGRLAHSVLLCGEKGLGAGFAARCLAADYLYPAGGPAAEAVLAGAADECIEVRGEGASGEIKVARVREVRREIYGTALSAAGRAVLFYDAHRLNASSGNALLKLLEEPPAGALFILTASSPAAILPTLRSRCAVYTLSPVSETECAAWLQAHAPRAAGAPPLGPQQLAAVYAGQLGEVMRVLQNPQRAAVLADALKIASLAAKHREYELLCALAAYEPARRGKKKPARKPAAKKGPAAGQPAAKEPEEGQQPDARLLLRDLACLGSAGMRGQDGIGLPPALGARLARAAGDAAAALAANANPKLVLTNLAIHLAQP